MKLLKLLVLSLLSTQVYAADIEYSKDAEKIASESGKPYVLDFYASWCSTCRKQKSVLEKLLKEDEIKDITVFKVDYDEETELKKLHNVKRQSTLILLKKDNEISREVATTDEEELRIFLKKGL